jgi:predicted metal-binding protein
MSIERCQACDAQIDTDFDDGCYIEVGNMRRHHSEIILCKACRQDRDEIEEERANACDAGMFLAEMEEMYERHS